jgi:hypothetical protein
MGIPRRKSGGEYDLAATGPLGPQTVRPDEGTPVGSRNSTLKTDDSTWRLSDGMPSGWQRASFEGSPRNSRDLGRRRLRASDFSGGGGGDDAYGQAL